MVIEGIFLAGALARLGELQAAAPPPPPPPPPVPEFVNVSVAAVDILTLVELNAAYGIYKNGTTLMASGFTPTTVSLENGVYYMAEFKKVNYYQKQETFYASSGLSVKAAMTRIL